MVFLRRSKLDTDQLHLRLPDLMRGSIGKRMDPDLPGLRIVFNLYNVLTNRDKQSTKYIERFADRVPASTALAQAAKTVPAASAAEAELTG